MVNANKNTFYILLAIAMFLWGASWVNVKVLSSYINEFEVVFFRFFITSITMIPIMIFLKKSFKIDLKTFGLVVLASIVLIAYMKYFFLGTKFGTASLGGSFVTSLIPIVTFLMMVALGRKEMLKKDMFALVLGAVGVLTMLNIWNSSIEEVLVIHNLYFILAAILWPILTIVSSKSIKISPIVFTFYLYAVTTVLDVIFFLDFNTIAFESFDHIFWINIAIITLGASTFGNTIYFLGIEKLGAAEVSSFIFLVPFSAILLSAVFLKEEITISILIGTVLTLIAVKIINNIRIFKKKKLD